LRNPEIGAGKVMEWKGLEGRREAHGEERKRRGEREGKGGERDGLPYILEHRYAYAL